MSSWDTEESPDLQLTDLELGSLIPFIYALKAIGEVTSDKKGLTFLQYLEFLSCSCQYCCVLALCARVAFFFKP